MKHAITILELYAQHNELNAPLHDREGEADQARLCREQADDYRKAIAALDRECAPDEVVALSETDAGWIVGVIAEPKAPNEKLMAAKKAYDDEIEQKIQEKGLTAPRITPADIEASIAIPIHGLTNEKRQETDPDARYRHVGVVEEIGGDNYFDIGAQMVDGVMDLPIGVRLYVRVSDDGVGQS